jgi:flavin reductase ActVB
MPPTEVTPELFRAAWSTFATGVTVITTAEADGTGVHGMTANGVASISLEPPLAMVTIGYERNSLPLIVQQQRFGISVLAADQQGTARHFTVPDEIRNTLPQPATEKLGKSPVISDALAAMDCRVVQAVPAGDHEIFIAEIEHIRIGCGAPLIFYQSNFVELA